MTTAEIRRGDFVYRDTLFVDPGGDRRHARASVSELKDLLLPSKKKGATFPAKDQVAHWYEAQLVHYGLPRTKDKNTAKVRLTSAINAGSLAVPSHILEMEANMKKEFTASRRKGKAVAKKREKETESQTGLPKGKKRKIESEGGGVGNSRTKVSVTVGNVTFDIDHQDGATSGVKDLKKRKITPAPNKASGTSSTKGKKTLGLSTAKKKTGPTDTSKKSATKNPSQSAGKDSATYATKQTARRTPSQVQFPKTKPKPKPTPKKATTTTTTQKKNKTNTIPDVYTRPQQRQGTQHEPTPVHGSYDDDIDMDTDTDANDEPPPPYESLYSRSPSASSPECNRHSESRSQSSSPPPPDTTIPIPIPGHYRITLPSSSSSPGEHTLMMIPDDRTGSIWGRFQIAGRHEGILHTDTDTDGRGVIDSDERVRILWRAEDLQSGELRFRRDQDGWIRFDEEGGVEGCWFGLHVSMKRGDGWDEDRVEDVEFHGRWVRSCQTGGGRGEDVDVDELMECWDGFVRSAYGR